MNTPHDTAGHGVRNVLFIMCDQLRADALSCYGGASALRTPNIDRLARLGARFERAYVSSAVCGPSRTSYYTGRYPSSHRVTWNRVPMPVDEWSLGDYLAEAGRDCWLLGKTHFVPDRRGLAARGLAAQGADYRERLMEGGFKVLERYDGHFEMEEGSAYRRYLIERGYDPDKPWELDVIGSTRADGGFATGWLLRNAGLPARVDERDSETAYLTDRAIDFIDGHGERPWVLHLSYIKPHWPYKAPAPYHDMYSARDAAAPVRGQAERERPHPVHGAYQRHEESLSFAQDEVWRAVRPVYMGLVRQIDDHVGRLLDHLERAGRLRDTLIVFCSDHGDLQGDHWLGEKEYFFDGAVRVPLIVYDPSPAADARRGQALAEIAECVDVVPTILDALGLQVPDQRVEGRSLLPWVRGQAQAPLREFAVGFLDYAYREARLFLDRGVAECNGMMVADGRYKYLHWQGFRPQLFDLRDDPGELRDLAEEPGAAPVLRRMREALCDWNWRRQRRCTESVEQVRARTHAHERMMNIVIGRW